MAKTVLDVWLEEGVLRDGGSVVLDDLRGGKRKSICWRCNREDRIKVTVDEAVDPVCGTCKWICCRRCGECMENYHCPDPADPRARRRRRR